jgi:DNA-binding transcriptional ArsR family regulator
MRTCARIDASHMDPIISLQAEVCRVLSHPSRIAILHKLAAGPITVTALARDLDVSQPNASQHLAVMRAAGLIEPERIGRETHYRLSDPDMLAACELMGRVLRRRVTRMADLVVTGRTASLERA